MIIGQRQRHAVMICSDRDNRRIGRDTFSVEFRGLHARRKAAACIFDGVARFRPDLLDCGLVQRFDQLDRHHRHARARDGFNRIDLGDLAQFFFYLCGDQRFDTGRISAGKACGDRGKEVGDRRVFLTSQRQK